MSGGDQARRAVARYATFSAVALAGTALAATLLVPVAAQAQTASADNKRFDIPAQPVAGALAQFGEQSGLQVTTPGALPEGRGSTAVSGILPPAEALSRLLSGTGLTFRFDGNDAIRIEAAPQTTGGAVQLDAVRVEGDGTGRGSARASDTSQLPETYAGGQVAYGGRVGLLGNRDFMETPFNTISYTAKLIEDRQAQDITIIIAATDPAIFSPGATGISNEFYSIRGFTSSVGDVTVNGLYGVAPFYRSSPEMFERVEVLKGPSALLNGMPPGGSVGGTINMVPKRATDAPITRLTGTYMSDAQFGGHMDLGRRFGEDKVIGVRFNGVYRDGRGAVDQQHKKTALASLGFDLRTDSVRLSGDLYYSEDRTDGLNRGISLAAGIPVPAPPRAETLLNPSWAFYDTRDRAAIFRGEVDLSEQVMFHAAVGASRTNYRSTGAFTIQVFNRAGDYRTNLADLSFQMSKRSAEAGLNARLDTGGIGHQLSLTGTYYDHVDRQFGRRNVLATDYVTNIYNPVWGPPSAIFLAPPLSRAKLRLTSFGIADILSAWDDRIQLTIGVRRQEVRSNTYSPATGARTAHYEKGATSPAFALLVKASEKLSFYANYIQGLSQGATAPATAANFGEVFPPFKTKQIEAGAKLDLGGFAQTLSIYQIERPASLTDLVTNIFSFDGEQRNRGVEWSFFGSPAKNLRLMGGVGYVDPKVTRTAIRANEGLTATGVPKWQAKLGAEWDVAGLEGLTLTGNAAYASRVYVNANNSLSVPSRTIFDAGARYTTSIADHALTFRATVTNITNRAYWAVPQFTNLILGAPRTVQLSVSAAF